ncbi:hypothetical protein LptCag_1684 [Leptospirillum ferriphilum]|uniref:Uncharacterized protein n=1 Tax=Leptospirillum ferriphilum TaxID=178606 RepID=A0A094W8M6_9BACT|nr:hypothetical protein LptCag_1684 [Leptospirillum ferriphilum]OOH73580.1 hypothetical protein BOX24_03625 [Leptospirillum ferriphilum]
MKNTRNQREISVFGTDISESLPPPPGEHILLARVSKNIRTSVKTESRTTGRIPGGKVQTYLSLIRRKEFSREQDCHP